MYYLLSCSITTCWVQWYHATVTHTPCIVCCCSYRIQRKVVSLCVYKHGDWLQLSTYHDRYDCINTLVIHCATAYCFPVPVGDHNILTHLWYPVHSSQFCKQRSSHSVWNCVLSLQKTFLWKFCSFPLYYHFGHKMVPLYLYTPRCGNFSRHLEILAFGCVADRERELDFPYGESRQAPRD